MGDLIPNEPLIYERVDNLIYARYRDKPDIPRWVIGGEESQTTLGMILDELVKLRDRIEDLENNVTDGQKMKRALQGDRPIWRRQRYGAR